MKSQNKTQNSKVDWVVELFPFKVKDPNDSETSSIPGALEGSLQPYSWMVEEPINEETFIDDSTWWNGSDTLSTLSTQNTESPIDPLDGLFGDKAKKEKKDPPKGLTAVSLGRSKGSPDGQCRMTFVGRLPHSAVIGTWVIVSTVTARQKVPVPRFLGQIQDISTSYMTQSSGLVSLHHEVNVREWSSCLRMEVRFNPVSILAALASTGTAGGLDAIANEFNAGQADGEAKKFTPQVMAKIYESSLNPYLMAQTVLNLVGAISSLDLAPNAKKLEVGGYSSIATSMPAIPKELLARMGVDPKVLSESAFAPSIDVRGFVTVISGIQGSPFQADGSWDGILKPSELKEFIGKFDSEPGDKPSSPGVAVLTQMSYSVWDILTQHCEPAINEVFTDMLYTEDKDGSIIPHPTIFFRDKPFLMDETIEKAKERGYEIKSFWSLYENVPRVFIDDVYIVGLNINNSFINSPNYIQVDFNITNDDKKMDQSDSLANGIAKLKSLQKRWGGDPAYPRVAYTFIEKSGSLTGSDISDYIKEITGVMVAWHSYNYRMGSGVLIIKDPGIPLTLGTNIQFSFGGRVLCGHIEGIDMQMNVDENGNVITQIQINLQRIVAITGATAFEPGKMRLLKMGESSRLDKPPYPDLDTLEIIGDTQTYVSDLLPYP